MIDEAAIGKAMSRYNKWLSEQNPEKLRARIAALEAALKPFAYEASMYDLPEDDESGLACMSYFKISDLRAARAAMEK